MPEFHLLILLLFFLLVLHRYYQTHKMNLEGYRYMESLVHSDQDLTIQDRLRFLESALIFADTLDSEYRLAVKDEIDVAG